MKTINTYALAYGATVFGSYSDRDEINVSPEYQRNGDVWSLEKKQLLIDSILNRYDIPKLYFHKLSDEDKEYEYAIIDGRQRLESIWKFIDGDFALDSDFSFLRDPAIDLGGMTYTDLARDYPKIKNQFDSTMLPIVVVDTEDLELIEDMFSRLNEAVPLNASEKRNAIQGYCISAVNKLAKQHFFTKRVRFTNSRYQHREVAIRLLFIEHCVKKDDKLIDTKKVYLDGFAKKYRVTGEKYISDLSNNVSTISKYLASIFTEKDSLLSSQASIPIYYLVARDQLVNDGKITLTRKQIEQFQILRKVNRKMAENDLEKAEFELLEYDRLSQQGTNDASSIRERRRVMLEYIV
jgi:hypothetical protein